MVYYDGDNPDYKKCCEIIERLEEFDSKILSNLMISIVANYPETRDYVIGQFQDILTDEDNNE